MDTSIVPYVFESHTIRTMTDEGGKPLFCGKDVSRALGYENHSEALKYHCRGVARCYPIVDSLGRTQQARFITEADVLRLIVSSKLESAQRFESWVFDEVLPTILKTGGYQLHPGVPMSFADALQLAADQQRLIESQAAQIGNMTPMAQLGSAVSGRDYMTLRDWISELKNERSEVKEKRVHQFLIERGFLYRNPMRRLRAYAQHDHLFALKEICCADGQYRSTLVITGAGMSRLYDAVLNDAVETKDEIGGLRIV